MKKVVKGSVLAVVAVSILGATTLTGCEKSEPAKTNQPAPKPAEKK